MVTWPELIVSTSTSLCHIHDRKVEVVEQRGALYFGITWNEIEMYVVCSYRNAGSTIARFDHHLHGLGDFTVPAQHVHQVLWHNNKLFVTMTETNQIGRVMPNSPELEVVYESGGSIVDKIGEDHINSLWFAPDGGMYVCGHRQSSRFDRPSRIRVVRPPWIEKEMFVGRNCHNVYVENECLYACDSSNWALLCIDLSTGTRRSVPVGGFARGFARAPDGYIVGVSQDAPREQRASSSSKLVYISNEMQLVDEIALNGFGDVQDLRVLGRPDPSHNNIPFTVVA